MLTREQADDISDRVLDRGRDHNTVRLTATVLDSGGHPIVVKRDDGSEFLRVDNVIGKVWGALGMGLPRRAMVERAEHFPSLSVALAALSVGKVAPVDGGVIIRREGVIVGDVGVSGDTSHVDEEAAVAAIEGAGLQADFGQVDE